MLTLYLPQKNDRSGRGQSLYSIHELVIPNPPEDIYNVTNATTSVRKNIVSALIVYDTQQLKTHVAVLLSGDS